MNERLPSELALGIIVILAIIIGWIILLDNDKYNQNKAAPLPDNQLKACTMEAKICPDGSTVGRTGPNCEFTPCPTESVEIDTSNWKTYRNERYGFEFKYPKDWTNITKDYVEKQYIFSNSIELNSIEIEKGGIFFNLTIGSDINLFDALYKLKPMEKFDRNLVIYKKISNLIIGEFPAVKYSVNRSAIPASFLPMGDGILIKKADITFHFVFMGLPEILQKNEFISNQILSTFKFIN